MDHRYKYVTEIDLITDERKYYIFPCRLYQHLISFEYFLKNNNWTDKRLFRHTWSEELNMGWDEFDEENALHCENVFDFYKQIGYEYKKKRYNTGEKIKEKNV